MERRWKTLGTEQNKHFFRRIQIVQISQIKQIKSLSWSEVLHKIYLMLEPAKFFMFESFFNIVQPFFGSNKFQLKCKGCDSFVLSLKTKDLNLDLVRLN